MQHSLLSYAESLKDTPSLMKAILSCFRDGAKHRLQEIYSIVDTLRPGTKESTVRGRLNENNGKLFRRVARGVYVAIQ